MNEPAAPKRTPEERLVPIGGIAAEDPRFAQFAADFAAHLLTAPPVTGEIRPANAWVVLSALQLALAHPHFPESIRPVVETFARQLQALVSVTPTLAEVAEAGWHRDQDVPVALPAAGAAAARKPPAAARCPTCGELLVPVVYPGGVWSEEQWASVRCGDWYCPTCPANGRGHPALCYWWQREVVR